MRGSPTISRSANIRFAYLPARDNRVSLIFTLSPEGGRSRKLLFEGKIDNSNFIIVIKLRYYRICICICISVRCILIKFVEAMERRGERGNKFHVYEAEWYFRRADVHSIRVFRKNSFEIRIPLDRGIERAGFGGFPDRSAGGHCLTTSRDPCGSTTARPPCILLSKHGADIFALPVV